MRRWQMVTGWVMAVAVASAVGFIAIALVGVGLDPLSGAGTSSAGSIGALGVDEATPAPNAQSAGPAQQLQVVTPSPLTSAQGVGPGGAPGDGSDSVGESSPAVSPRPSTVAPSGSGTRPKPTPSTTTTTTRSVSTAGGSATARCTGSRIVLSAWSPAPGYSVDEVRAGPSDSVEVSFEGSSLKVKIKAECSKGVPRFENESRSEDSNSDD